MLYFYRPSFKAGKMIAENVQEKFMVKHEDGTEHPLFENHTVILTPADNGKAIAFKDEAAVLVKYPEFFFKDEAAMGAKKAAIAAIKAEKMKEK